MQPLAQAKGDWNVQHAIEDPVGGIKSRHMTFGHKRYSQAEMITPVGKRSLTQVPRQFVLYWPIHQVGIAPYRLDPDEQGAKEQAHDQEGDREWTCDTPPRLSRAASGQTRPLASLAPQGAIPPPLEDDDRGVVVPIEGHATIAFDPAIRQRKMLEDGTASRARLGRVGWIDLDHLATGAFSLLRETGNQVGPTRIQNAHGEAAVHHGGDTEFFEHDPIEPRDQFVDELVEEVFPGVGHMDHQALESENQSAAVPATAMHRAIFR